MRLSVALLCFFLTLQPVYGKDNDVFSLSLKQLLDVTVSVSTFQQETVLDVPSSVAVFDKEEIEQLGVFNISQLMNYVAGYQSYRGDAGNNSNFFSSRARRSGQNMREILLLVNGVRANVNSGNGSLIGQDIPLDNVERVEVIRGAGSSLYGENAFLGVINVVTKTDNSAFINLGVDGDNRAYLQSNLKFGEHELQISAWSRRRIGNDVTYYDANNAFTFQGQDEYQYHGIQLQYDFQGWDFQTHYSKENNVEGFVFGFPARNSGEGSKIENWHNRVKYTHYFGNDWLIENSFLYHQSKVQPTSSISIEPLIGLDGNIGTSEWALTSVLKSSHSKTGEWVLGTEYREGGTDRAEQRTFGVVNRVDQIQSEEKSYVTALFVQNQYRISDTLRTITGFRYDHYSQFGGQISPRLGVNYELNSSNTIKFIYAEAFRAPTRGELYLINSPVLVGNRDLQPEVSKTMEVIWVRVDEHGYTQTSFFNTKIVDSIIESDFNLSARTWINGSTEHISGMEVDRVARVHENWKLRLATTYFFERPLDELSSESRFLLTGAVTYVQDKFDITLSANHQSDKVAINNSESGSRTYAATNLVDLNGRYRLSDKTSLVLRVRNLLDKDYQTPASQVDNLYGVDGYQRQAWFGIKFSFD